MAHVYAERWINAGGHVAGYAVRYETVADVWRHRARIYRRVCARKAANHWWCATKGGTGIMISNSTTLVSSASATVTDTVMATFAAASPHISVKADTVATIGGFTVTNSQVLGAFGLIVLVWLMFRMRLAVLGRKKHTFATRLMQWTFEGLYNTVKQVVQDEAWARRVAPLTITIFFFVVAQYWLGLLPVVGPITVGEHGTPLLRGGVADLNMTFGLAIVTIVAAQVYAFKYMGFRGNMGRYFVNPLRDPIMSFVGILELVAEFSRMLGLSFRLFGNVLAGEILLIVISYMAQFASPVALQPFYFFELFIGGIQAYIFFMLSTVFISLGLVPHGDHDESHNTPDHSLTDNSKLAAEGEV